MEPAGVIVRRHSATRRAGGSSPRRSACLRDWGRLLAWSMSWTRKVACSRSRGRSWGN